MSKENLQYLEPGEELVREPFQLLIDPPSLADLQMQWPACMDTFKDKQALDD